MKRALDLLISTISLLLLLPLFLIISVFIKIESTGGIFYTQERLGKNLKPFKFYKFRTMYKDSDKLPEGFSALEGDKRITKVGKILRDWSIDELPQLLNVIQGKMSIVGPRPCLEKEFRKFLGKKEIKKRFEVNPGITGLAQVSGRNNLTWEEKIPLDLEYINTLNSKGIYLDISIILRTIRVVLQKEGLYEEDK